MGLSIDFTGKTVLVTGAGRGLGKAMALTFAKAGADVNEDGVADTEDAVLILQYGAEKIAAF